MKLGLDIHRLNKLAKTISGNEHASRLQRSKDFQRRKGQERLAKKGELPNHFNGSKIIMDDQFNTILTKSQLANIYNDVELSKIYLPQEIESAVESEWQEILNVYEDSYIKNTKIPNFIRNMLLDIRASGVLFGVLYETFGENTPNIINLIVSNFIIYNKNLQADSELYNLFIDFYYTVNGYRADAISSMFPIDKNSAEALVLFLPKYGKLGFNDIKSGTFKAMSILYDSQISADVTTQSLNAMFNILYSRDKLKFAAISLLLESKDRKYNRLSPEKKALWDKLTTMALDILELDYQNVFHNIGTIYMTEIRRQNGEKRLSLKSIDSKRYPNIFKAVDYSIGKDSRLSQFV